MPDIHRAEVGTARFGIANTLDDRHFPFIIELFDRSHRGMKPDGVIDRQHLILGNADFWPVIAVQGVAVRDNSIQAVVTPGQLQDNQNRSFGVCCHNMPSLRLLGE
jgi:hypothetical protein